MKERPPPNLSFNFTAPAPKVTQSGGGTPPAQPPDRRASGADPTGDVPSPLSPPGHAPAPAPKPAAEPPRALTVAELDRAIKRSVEDAFFDSVWVEGEVTGARPAASGHLYFCLKDEREDASVDVVMYKTSITQRARALIADGARVRLRGKPTFWAPRGRLQFVADRAEAVGRGALLEALEKLKAKLQAEGLFATERKRALPPEARVIGVVTSAGGAVIHDVCKVAFRRGGARILLAPALVQGQGAAESIRRALVQLARVADVDAIIVGRGGGSSDDLMAFNDEALVRAVAACRVPVVSAVGHEVDVTLVDFAADARAATPSQAAEMLVPDRASRRAVLAQTRARLARTMVARLAHDRADLAELRQAMGDPRLAIASHQQSLDDRRARLETSIRAIVTRRRDLLGRGQQRLAFVHPRAVIARERAALVRLSDSLSVVVHRALQTRTTKLTAAASRLDALSPLKVLSRGYAIATEGGRAVRDAGDVRVGATIRVRVAKGALDATVDAIIEDDS